MTLQSPGYANEQIYAAWHRPLLEELFAHEMDPAP